MFYSKLDAHYVHQSRGGVQVDAHRLSVTLNNGTVVDFPVPFVALTKELAVRVAWGFEADLATRWTDSPDDIEGWLRSWAAANDVALTD